MDYEYTLLLKRPTHSGRYEIGGWKRTTLVWNDSLQQWSMKNLRDNAVVAFTNETRNYPLGVQKWYFTSEKCADPGQQWRRMSLSVCGRDEFACNSGECIKMELRGDKSFNCKDYSGEEN